MLNISLVLIKCIHWDTLVKNLQIILYKDYIYKTIIL